MIRKKRKPVSRKAGARRFARRIMLKQKVNVSEQAALDQALASAMPVTVAMTMAVAVESMRCTAEAAICRGATLNEAPVRAARSIGNASGTAIDTRHKTHRYRANRRGTHHGQDDAAGTFHAITCTHTLEEPRPSLSIQASALKPQHSSLWHSRLGIEADLRSAHKPKPAVSQDRAGRGPGGLVSAAAGKMRRERVRKRAESTARHAA